MINVLMTNAFCVFVVGKAYKFCSCCKCKGKKRKENITSLRTKGFLGRASPSPVDVSVAVTVSVLLREGKGGRNMARKINEPCV